MIEYKQNISAKIPVRILDGGGDPVPGILFSDITAAVQKSDGTTQILSVATQDWAEVATGAFSNAGLYWLDLPISAMDTTGYLTVAVASTGNKTFIGAFKVVANEEIDTFTRIGAPVGASISADLQTNQVNLLTVVNTLKKYEEGRWKIHITGPDANRLVLYDTDDVTPLLKFDLKDSGGAATFFNPFERVPTP